MIHHLIQYTSKVQLGSLLLRSQRYSSSISSLLPDITIPNDGQSLKFPLPGLPGITNINLSNDFVGENGQGKHINEATIQDLSQYLKDKDSSLKHVDFFTPDGKKLASSFNILNLVDIPFLLRLNDLNILVQSTNQRQVIASKPGDSHGFSTLRQALATYKSPIISLKDFHTLCYESGAQDDETILVWLKELQRRSIVVHFQHSPHGELQKTLLLRPTSTENYTLLQYALDKNMENILMEMNKRVKEKELVQEQVDQLNALDMKLRIQARTLPTIQKWASLSGLTCLYGTLMYCVWDVYSWDVMEPITYFIGLTAVVGESFYHTITKKGATYSNIWQKRYIARLERLKRAQKVDNKKLPELQSRLDEIDHELQLLAQLYGKQ